MLSSVLYYCTVPSYTWHKYFVDYFRPSAVTTPFSKRSNRWTSNHLDPNWEKPRQDNQLVNCRRAKARSTSKTNTLHFTAAQPFWLCASRTISNFPAHSPQIRRHLRFRASFDCSYTKCVYFPVGYHSPLMPL